MSEYPCEFLKFRKLDENAFQILITGNCYYSSPDNFNDPLDSTYSIESFPTDLREEMRNDFMENEQYLRRIDNFLDSTDVIKCDWHGVVSFTGRFNNTDQYDPILSPELWGHYAHNHEGICIGFSPRNPYKKDGSEFHDTTNNLLSEAQDQVLKLHYCSNYSLPIPDWSKVRSCYNKLKNNNNIDPSPSLFIKKITFSGIDKKKVFSTKHINWKYENEYRLLGNSNKSKNLGAAISSVTFGLRLSEETKITLINLLCRFYGNNRIKLYDMKIKDGKLERVSRQCFGEIDSYSQSFSGINITE